MLTDFWLMLLFYNSRKHPKNNRFSGVSKGYIMVTMARNGLMIKIKKI